MLLSFLFYLHILIPGPKQLSMECQLLLPSLSIAIRLERKNNTLTHYTIIYVYVNVRIESRGLVGHNETVQEGLVIIAAMPSPGC